MVNKVIQRNIRISHRKAQLVCDLIRNQPVAKAIIILKSTNKKIAPIVLKLLNSAIANATNNHAMNAEKLYIYNIFANQGPTMKRTMPRARGSADMIRKRSTHIEIHLSDNPDERKLALAKKPNKTKPNKKPKVQAKPEPKKVEPKPEPKPKKPKASDIPVDKKHEVVSMKEFEDYNYDKRRKEWHKKAGHNEKQEVCSICKDDDNWASVLLENGKHVCYYCWIKRPDTLEKLTGERSIESAADSNAKKGKK